MSELQHDHVHRLIRSMTRAEKRYFKLYITRHASGPDGNHGILFDAIAKMEQYDEAALRHRFTDKAFMRRFHIAKHRLYEALLASLDAFHADGSVDARLQRSLHHVEILYQRALYPDAARMLRSVRCMAREHDRQAILLLVAEWERRLMERANYADVSDRDLKEREGKVGAVLEEWREVDRLWQVKSRSFRMIFRNGHDPTLADKVELEELRSHPLLAEGVPLHTVRAKFLHHHVRSALAYAANDLEECERQLGSNLKLMRDEPSRFKDETDLLLGVMGNMAHVRMRLGKHREAVDGFHAFRQVPLLMASAPSADLELKLFVLGSSLKLSLHTVKGEFAEAMVEVGEVEQGLERHGGSASRIRRSELYLQLAYACFGAEHYDLALRWCNRVLNGKGIEDQAGVHELARILDLMILLEKGKLDLLPYTLRNLQRTMRTRQRPDSMLKAMMDLGHAQLHRNKQAGAPFRDLVERLEVLSGQGAVAAALDQVDVLSWALAKSQGRSFGEVVRERWAEHRSKKPEHRSSGPLKAA